MASTQTSTGKKSTSKTAAGIATKKALSKKAVTKKTASTQTKKVALTKTTKQQTAAKKSTKASATVKPASSKGVGKSIISAEERYQMIAAAAYSLAESRGFESGHALDDWISAELKIDAMLKV